MTVKEQVEEMDRHLLQSKELFAKCEETFSQCDRTFALCDEHIRYLQDESELKRIDEQIEEIKMRTDALIAKSRTLRESDEAIGMLVNKLVEQ
jgi:hypothetical protein